MNPIRIKPLSFPWETHDPFLFCAFHLDHYPASNGEFGPKESLEGRTLGQDFAGKDGWNMYHGQEVPGFPAHPHYGFETVTIAKRGMVDHSDSLGSSGRFGDGDVQWMTAGKGVQHAEMFPLIHEDRPNPLLLFQIWLNLPASSKKVEPYYGMLWHEDIPLYKTEKNGKFAEVDIIAGSIGGMKALDPAPDSWAAKTSNEVAIMIIRLDPGAELVLPGTSTGINRALYFYEGSNLNISGNPMNVMHSADLPSESDVILINGDKSSELLYLQGKPIREPVAQYGPFVTNSQQEIQEVIHEFQRTQFGGWPWPSHSPTHSKEKGRFAQYVDGTIESK